MCIYTGILGIFTPFSYAFAPQLLGAKSMYTVVFFWNCLAALLGGISSASGGPSALPQSEAAGIIHVKLSSEKLSWHYLG